MTASVMKLPKEKDYVRKAMHANIQEGAALGDPRPAGCTVSLQSTIPVSLGNRDSLKTESFIKNQTKPKQ